MVRKRLLPFLLMLLLLGCAGQAESFDAPSPVPSAATQPVFAVESDAAVMVSAPDPTEPPATAEPTAKVEKTYIGCMSETPAAPQEHVLTVKAIDRDQPKQGGQYGTTFYNETVNFQHLRISIEDFRSDESGTLFSVRAELPDEWSDLQCLSIHPCFGFRFYLDGRPQNDFRLVDQTPIMSEALTETRCSAFTMTYGSTAVTDAVMHAAHEWRIVPFYLYRIVFGGSKYNDHPGGYIALDKGEVCRFNGTEDAFFGGKIDVTELPEFALTLPIDHIDGEPKPLPEPRMLQVSVWTEDVERNKAAGSYGSDGRLKDGTAVNYGTYQNQTVDFSGFEIHIERFFYWEHGFFMLLRYDYPEEWPEDVRRCVRIRWDVYANGELFGESPDGGKGKRTYFRGSSTGSFGGYPEYRDESFGTEWYEFFDQKRFSLENPFPVKELTFRFRLEFFPKIEDLHGRQHDLTDGKPFYVDRYMSGILEKVPLLEIMVPTDQLVFPQGGAR